MMLAAVGVLKIRLAVETATRSRNGVQSLLANVFSTIDASAVCAH
jgi:hypothetical protein